MTPTNRNLPPCTASLGPLGRIVLYHRRDRRAIRRTTTVHTKFSCGVASSLFRLTSPVGSPQSWPRSGGCTRLMQEAAARWILGCVAGTEPLPHLLGPYELEM